MEKTRYKKSYGDKGEKLAALYLEQAGYRIMEKNFRCRQGEIDIIAREKQYLCFIEVKRRKDITSGHPFETINPWKIKRICKTALFYLQTHHLSDATPVRFDVISIVGEEVSLLRDAFSFQY